MLSLLTTYIKPVLILITTSIIVGFGYFLGFYFENAKFNDYKISQEVIYKKQIEDFIHEQKEQNIKDNKLVSDLNNKISELQKVSDERKSKLSQLLKENSSIKECKLDSTSLEELNKSIKGE